MVWGFVYKAAWGRKNTNVQIHTPRFMFQLYPLAERCRQLIHKMESMASLLFLVSVRNNVFKVLHVVSNLNITQ